MWHPAWNNITMKPSFLSLVRYFIVTLLIFFHCELRKKSMSQPVNQINFVPCRWCSSECPIVLLEPPTHAQILIPEAQQWLNFSHCCFGHVGVRRRCDMSFWKFYGKWGIKRAFHEAKEHKVWIFIVWVMVIRGNLFIWGQCGQHKKILEIFFFNKKIKNCAMLDRFIATREALVHSIPISEVKDMKSDVLHALKGFLFEKKLWTLFAGSFLTIFKKEKLHRFWNFFYNISTIGIKNIYWNLLAIPIFLSSHTHSYLHKNQVFLNFLNFNSFL